MSERLDAIKARLEDAVTTRAGIAHLNGLFIAHSAEDVSSLVAAVEAVLALHYRDVDDLCRDCCYNWPCPTVTAIRTALGED